MSATGTRKAKARDTAQTPTYADTVEALGIDPPAVSNEIDREIRNEKARARKILGL